LWGRSFETGPKAQRIGFKKGLGFENFADGAPARPVKREAATRLKFIFRTIHNPINHNLLSGRAGESVLKLENRANPAPGGPKDSSRGFAKNAAL